MIDKKLVEEAGAKETRRAAVKVKFPRASTGKIARLPEAIRTEVNVRLRNGQSASAILPWLNALPEVQQILAAQFRAKPISPRNLTEWRGLGFQRWLEKQEEREKREERRRSGEEVLKSAKGLACAAAAFLSDRLFELLESGEKPTIKDLLELRPLVTSLARIEQNGSRIEIAQKRVGLQEERVNMLKDKPKQEQPKPEAEPPKKPAMSEEEEKAWYAYRIDRLGRHHFGELWKPGESSESPKDLGVRGHVRALGDATGRAGESGVIAAAVQNASGQAEASASLPTDLRRPYQFEVLRHFTSAPDRFWALLWERQAGKSTTLADFALYEMLHHKNRTVIYGSASLLLARELPIKTALRANQSASEIVQADAKLLQQFSERAQTELAGVRRTGVPPVSDASFSQQFKTFDSEKQKEIRVGRCSSVVEKKSAISESDFAELFQQGRLEFRVYHDRTSYSRTKVIAPNVATARSWSGTVLLDEVAFIRDLRELVAALLPVISTDKQFKLILSTTPPEFDDTHYSFELLAPPAGAIFSPNAQGNWYRSESDIPVHRADVFDTALAGKKIYDLKSGAEIAPNEAFERAPNKEAHRIAHWLTWTMGGSAACDLLRLRTAQERGLGGNGGSPCQNFQITTDADMVPALNWLSNAYHANHLTAIPPLPAGEGRGEGELKSFSPLQPSNSSTRVALGFDVATTTKGKSNPSVISLMEEHGPEWLVRARFIWKTKDPDIANDRLNSILDVLQRCGIRPRALAQDATNERYYAEQNRKLFRRRLPVILVVASQTVDRPGLDKPTNWKEYLGQQLVAKLDDNNLTLPPDEYTRKDYRLVMRDRGRFICEPNDEGMHGDCFDADKLAGHALTATSNRRTIVPIQEWMREEAMARSFQSLG